LNPLLNQYFALCIRPELVDSGISYKKFPLLEWIKKDKTVRDQHGDYPYGIHSVTLANNEKVIEKDAFQDLSVRVNN
jgi:hypothetical protein